MRSSFEPNVRVQRLLNLYLRASPDDPHPYHELRRNKSKHLTSAALHLADSGTCWHRHAASIIQFVIDRKEAATFDAIERNRKLEAGERRKVDWHNALRYAETLPPLIRELLPKFDRFDKYHMEYRSSAVRALTGCRDALLSAVPERHRQYAIYYGAGHDIPTAVHALPGITTQIRFVDHCGFDWMFCPGQTWLREKLSRYDIRMDAYRPGSIDATYNERPVSLRFVRCNNSDYAACADPGAIIYVTGLAGTSGTELVWRHLRLNEGAVLTCFMDSLWTEDWSATRFDDQICYIYDAGRRRDRGG